MIEVRVWKDNLGCVHAEPTDAAVLAKYATHMEEWTGNLDGSAFFQYDWTVPEAITQHEEYGELAKGWDLTMDIDPWEFGHWLGYDACEVALDVFGCKHELRVYKYKERTWETPYMVYWCVDEGTTYTVSVRESDNDKTYEVNGGFDSVQRNGHRKVEKHFNLS